MISGPLTHHCLCATMNPAESSPDLCLARHLSPAGAPLGASSNDDLQDAAVRILARLRSDDAPRISQAYVYQARRTAAIDRTRRVARRRALLEANANALSWRSSPHDPERTLQSRELGRAIDQELQSLCSYRRELLMQFLEGHGISELAAKTGLDRKAVENRVYRSLCALRKRLRDRGLSPRAVLGS